MSNWEYDPDEFDQEILYERTPDTGMAIPGICGTEAAWFRHRRRGETVCESDRLAKNEAERRRRAIRRGVPADKAKRKHYFTRALQPCGTVAAYKRHCYHGEPTDAACRAAKAKDDRLTYWRKRGKVLV